MILKASRFIRNRTRIRRILPLRSLSHVKRRDLRGSESAAKGEKYTHVVTSPCDHARAFAIERGRKL